MDGERLAAPGACRPARRARQTGAFTVIDRPVLTTSLRRTARSRWASCRPVPSCAASRDQLWPPNGAMIPVSVDVGGTDATSGVAGFVLDSVTSSEGEGGFADGWQLGTADTDGTLRARRSGTAARTYTLGYTLSDAARNSASCAVTVLVPRDKGQRPGQAPA